MEMESWWEVGEVLVRPGAEGSLTESSARAPKDAKSVSWTGGAGADGDSAAFRGMFIGAGLDVDVLDPGA